MDEMSQEATASPCPFSDNLIVKKNKDGSMRVLLDTKLVNESMHRLPLNWRNVEQQEIARKFPTDSQRATARAMADEARLFRPRLTTAEKDEIAQEVSAISDRAAARIMDDDDDEFRKYVEATTKYGRTPTGLKFDHYSSAIATHAESYANYKRLMALDSMKRRSDQLTEQTRTEGRSRSASQRSEGRATAPTDLTEYSANSDEIRKIFAPSTEADRSSTKPEKGQISKST
jgi:DNA primase